MSCKCCGHRMYFVGGAYACRSCSHKIGGEDGSSDAQKSEDHGSD